MALGTPPCWLSYRNIQTFATCEKHSRTESSSWHNVLEQQTAQQPPVHNEAMHKLWLSLIIMNIKTMRGKSLTGVRFIRRLLALCRGTSVHDVFIVRSYLPWRVYTYRYGLLGFVWKHLFFDENGLRNLLLLIEVMLTLLGITTIINDIERIFFKYRMKQ